MRGTVLISVVIARGGMMNIRQGLIPVGEFIFPAQKFFEPTPEFGKWMFETAKRRLIYDVGSGMGHVSQYLVHECGLFSIPVDCSLRDGQCSATIIADATNFFYDAGSIVMLCRPCHGWFTADVIERAIERKCFSILYIGKVQNVDMDLGGYRNSFRHALSHAGKEDEMVWEFNLS